MATDLDVRRIELLHPEVVRVLRTKSGVERLRLAPAPRRFVGGARHRLHDRRIDRIRFERRQRQPFLPGKDAYFARPEDVILYQLMYVREGRSDQYLRDVAGMLAVSGSEIDTRYVREWVERLGVADIWESIRRRATGG